MSDDNKNDLYNRLNSLFEDNKMTIPDVIMSPRWRSDMQRSSLFVDVDPAKEGSDKTALGMNVYYSSFVEEGTAYLVPKMTSSFRFNPPPVDLEVMKRVEHFMRDYVYRAMGIPPQLFEDDKPYHWQRKPSETILQWGDRLFAKGLLDNPEIRWEYQKAVLGAPFNKMKAVWVRLRS